MPFLIVGNTRKRAMVTLLRNLYGSVSNVTSKFENSVRKSFAYVKNSAVDTAHAPNANRGFCFACAI